MIKLTKFNTRKQTIITPNRTNKEGATAFSYTPKSELIMRCASNFMEDNFYASAEEVNTEIRELTNEIGKTDPIFIMRLASWLRNAMNMRSVSIYLLALMAGHKSYEGKSKPWLIDYAPYILKRADEPAEVLAAYNAVYPGEKVPQALYKAINSRLNKISEYEAIKYRGKNDKWSLRDVIRVSHPFPADEKQSILFKWVTSEDIGIAELKESGLDTLANYVAINQAQSFDDIDEELLLNAGATWEFLTSKFGSNQKVWDIAANVMPGFAYMMNLRNIISKGSIDIDTNKIMNFASKKETLPFRFLTAKDAISSKEGLEFSSRANIAKNALAEAIEISTANFPNMGNVAILLDYSGSMTDPVSGKSSNIRSDIAKVFAAAAYKNADNAIIIEYNSNAHIVDNLRKNMMLVDIVDKLSRPGGATSLPRALSLAEQYVDKLDTLYILTDQQSWLPDYKAQKLNVFLQKMYGKNSFQYNYYVDMQPVEAYENMNNLVRLNKNLTIVNHNLANYGTADIPTTRRVINVAGWSTNVFDLLQFCKNGNIEEIVHVWSAQNMS